MALQIPTIDLNDLSSDDPTRIALAGATLREALGTYGLVYIRNHSVDTIALGAFYDAFRAFVARPEEEKKQCGRADIWFQRGWTPPNTEIAVASGGQPDFKECYFAAPLPGEPEVAAMYPELYPENVWPVNAPAGFQEGYLKLGKALHDAGIALLRGAAVALDLQKDTFVQKMEGGPHVTRVLNYLPLDSSQVNTRILWGEEHTDFNLLTLLPGGRFYNPQGELAGRPDDRSGLYLRTRANAEHPQGEMVRGAAPEGCIVAQVGQQLEILTGGTFLATPHVITAPGVPGWTRLSSAHFMHLESNQILFPLEPFRTPEVIWNYAPPVLAGTYSIKTLVDIGLAPKSALDKLGYRHYDRLDSMRVGKNR